MAMPDAAELLARLRRHCHGGWRGCPDCDPATSRYCAAALPDAVAFAAARRAEVLAAAERRAA
jgi:hypothetical protein